MKDGYTNKGQKPYEPHKTDSYIYITKDEVRKENRRYYKLGKIKIKCKELQKTFEGKGLTTAEMRKLREKK